MHGHVQQRECTGFITTNASIPTGLVASGGIEQVGLSWQPSSNAISYNVYRATNSGGPYTMVNNVASTDYADIQIIGNGTTYYYVVTAVNSLAGESGYSAEVSASTTVTLPSPWMTEDIGAPAWGSAFFSSGVFTIAGSRGRHLERGGYFPFCLCHDQQLQFHHGSSSRLAAKRRMAWSKAGLMVRDN